MEDNIIIEKTSVLWKSPILGTPSRRIPEHFYGRTIHALVNGEEMVYRLKADEIALEATEDDMINIIKQQIEINNTDNFSNENNETNDEPAD